MPPAWPEVTHIDLVRLLCTLEDDLELWGEPKTELEASLQCCLIDLQMTVEAALCPPDSTNPAILALESRMAQARLAERGR